MTISRRAVLVHGAAAGIVAFATLPGTIALAQSQTPRRRSIGELALNDPIVQTYRDAVRLMKGLPNTDRRNWTRLTSIHGTNQGFNLCPHGNWYFLPWHRAYLMMYERLCRSLTRNASFALPYWDWTQDRQLPPALAQRTWNGRPNPLFERSRTMSPTLSLPDNMVGPTLINQILAERNFEIFGSTRPNGQNSTNPVWLRRGGAQGPLEANPHNRVHGTVGGVMASGTSPIDPIFMLHHCNIDRLWAVWNGRGNRNTNDRLWLDFEFRNHFVNAAGNLMSFRVRDLQQILPLGYRYGLPATSVRIRPQLVNEGLTNLLKSGQLQLSDIDRSDDAQPKSARRAAVGQTAHVFRAEYRQAAEPLQPLETSVRVDRSLLDRIAQPRPGTGAGTEGLSVTPTARVDPNDRRMLGFISDIAPPADGNADVRVFLNCDYLGPETPTTDPHYVGAFSFFGGLHQGHGRGQGGGKVAVVFDLTPTLKALARQKRITSNEVRVQLIPIPLPGQDPAAVASFTPGRVEIAIV